MGEGLRHVADDLIRADGANQSVGQERERSAALAGLPMENDRAVLGDGDGTGGDHRVDFVRHPRLPLAQRRLTAAERLSCGAPARPASAPEI